GDTGRRVGRQRRGIATRAGGTPRPLRRADRTVRRADARVIAQFVDWRVAYSNRGLRPANPTWVHESRLGLDPTTRLTSTHQTYRHQQQTTRSGHAREEQH